MQDELLSSLFEGMTQEAYVEAQVEELRSSLTFDVDPEECDHFFLSIELISCTEKTCLRCGLIETHRL